MDWLVLLFVCILGMAHVQTLMDIANSLKKLEKNDLGCIAIALHKIRMDMEKRGVTKWDGRPYHDEQTQCIKDSNPPPTGEGC